MKLRILSSAVLAATAAVFFAGMSLSAQNQPVPPAFDATMKNLDQNGFALSYLNTGEAFEVGSKLLQALVKPAAAHSRDARLFSEVVSSVWKQSGAGAIRAIGRSGKKDGAFYTIRRFSYAPEELRSGFFWQISPSTPGLTMLDFAPADSRLACACNIEPGILWNVFERNFNRYANERQKNQLAEILEMFKQEGLDVPQFLSAVSGFGVFMSAPMSVTCGFRMKTPSVYEALAAVVKKNSPEYIKGNEIQIPLGAVMLTAFQYNDLILLTTDAESAKKCLSGVVRTLGTDPVFEQYSAGLTQSSSSWCYIAPGFISQILSLLSIVPQVRTFIPDSAAMSEVLAIAELDRPLFCVSDIRKDGCLTVTRTGSRPAAFYFASPEVESLVTTFAPILITSLAQSLVPDDDDDDDGDDGDDGAGNAEKNVKVKEQVRSIKGK